MTGVGKAHPPARAVPLTVRRLNEALSEDRGDTVLAWVASGAFLGAVLLLGVPFLLGTAPFWAMPRGSIGHGWADMTTAVTAVRFFQQGAWSWPLLAVPPLGIPGGTNVAFTDGIPAVALLSRLIFGITHHQIVLFGLWTALCLAGSATALALLTRLLGARSAAAAIAAGVIGFTFPPLLFRWGHPALMAQAEIPCALALYVWRRRGAAGTWPFLLTLGLCALALLTNAYLFLMVTGLIAVFYIQDAWSRPQTRLRHTAEAAAIGALLVAMLVACGWIGGHDAARGGATLRTIGFGVFSANLLGPFVPQRSGLIPSMAHLVVDATGAQYEGFSYCGAGLLLLLAFLLAGGFPWRHALSRHAIMIAVLLGFGVLSLSDQVYLGPWHAATLPMPSMLRNVMDVVRSSGRFVWPPLYAAAAIAIAAAARRQGGSYLLLAAACLQWADTAPLRHIIADEIAHPAPQPVNFDALRQAVTGRDSAHIVPSFACLADPPGWSKAFALELQSAASMAFVPTNTVYQSRHTPDCDAERQAASWPGADNVLRAYLPEWPGFAGLAAAKLPGCIVTQRVILCADSSHGALPAMAASPNPAWKPPVDQPWLGDPAA